MPDRLETKKYTFTVEGETEQWYLLWLCKQINACDNKKNIVSISAKVQQHPMKFAKSVNAISTPEVTHICDVESKAPLHAEKFRKILDELKEAEASKNISYDLGYSNYTFELWIILHKRNCNGPLSNRRQYLSLINGVFHENFENLDQYKHEANFKRCLAQMDLNDVRAAIQRAKEIVKINEETGKTLTRYGRYKYYADNPALSIHEAIGRILQECGLI